MRLPTPAALIAATRRVATRFPETTLAAIAAYGFATLSLRGSGSPENSRWWSWFLAAALAIPAGVALAVIFERLEKAARADLRAGRLAAALAVLALFGAFAMAWPGWSTEIQVKRLLHLSLGIHLLVAFAPFLLGHHPNAFWQWNRALFVRFVTAALFSSVLFIGLAIALAAGKPLFGIDVPGDVFLDLWFAVALLINTGYFLAGVPEDFEELEREESYPAALKVFAQYILAPLVVVYLTILSLYLVKVVVTGQWPKGWIGWLVSSVSVAGMLSLLLVEPVRERAGNRWIGIYARTFYLALLPSLAMLFAAIGKRIGQYGVTEDRYFLLVLAIWVTLMAVGYGFRRLRDIRWIPITLCLVAFVTWWGPWGAYGVSRANQAHRLTALMERHGVFAGGKRVTPPPVLAAPIRREMSSVIDYLARTHGVPALPEPLRRLAPSKSELKKEDYRWRGGQLVARAVMGELGLGYVDPWEAEESHYVSYYEQLGGTVVEDIGGFTRMVTFQGAPPIEYRTEEGGGRIALDAPMRTLVIVTPRGTYWRLPLDSLLRALDRNPSSMRYSDTTRARYEFGDAAERGRLVIRQMYGYTQSDSVAIHSLAGDLYLGGNPAAVTPAVSR